MTKLVGKISDGVFINMATPAKVKEIAARVREGAAEAGRDPSKIEIIAKSRVSLNPDRNLARAKLRQVLTFITSLIITAICCVAWASRKRSMRFMKPSKKAVSKRRCPL